MTTEREALELVAKTLMEPAWAVTEGMVDATGQPYRDKMIENTAAALKQAGFVLAPEGLVSARRFRELVEKWREDFPGNGDYYIGLENAMLNCADDLETAIERSL